MTKAKHTLSVFVCLRDLHCNKKKETPGRVKAGRPSEYVPMVHEQDFFTAYVQCLQNDGGFQLGTNTNPNIQTHTMMLHAPTHPTPSLARPCQPYFANLDNKRRTMRDMRRSQPTTTTKTSKPQNTTHPQQHKCTFFFPPAVFSAWGALCLNRKLFFGHVLRSRYTLFWRQCFLNDGAP